VLVLPAVAVWPVEPVAECPVVVAVLPDVVVCPDVVVLCPEEVECWLGAAEWLDAAGFDGALACAAGALGFDGAGAGVLGLCCAQTIAGTTRKTTARTELLRKHSLLNSFIADSWVKDFRTSA
jgi:hypothetical protein